MWWNAPPINPAKLEYRIVRVVLYDGDPGDWNKYVAGHSAGSPYHTWEWRELIRLSFGFECPYLAAMEDDRIVGILPLTIVKSRLFGNSIVSGAFADFGGVCAEHDTAAHALLEYAAVLASRCNAKYVEFRHAVAINDGEVETFCEKAISFLPLPETTDELFRRFDVKLRNQVRKAEKSGFQVSWGGVELIPEFYDVMARNMRDLGTPVLAESFFHNVVQCFSHTSDVLILSIDNIPVSCGLGLTYRGTMEVPWASSRRDYFQYCPNIFLYKRLLDRCVERGTRYFSFGRSTANSSTFRFKQQWGALSSPLHYQFLGHKAKMLGSPGSSPVLQRAIRVWRKLPVGLTRVLGPKIACQLP